MTSGDMLYANVPNKIILAKSELIKKFSGIVSNLIAYEFVLCLREI